MIRKVNIKDAREILDIYNYYVSETIVTFDLDPQTVEVMEDKIRTNKDQFAWLVYEDNGKIIGYAYASQWKSKCAYNNCVESTIYLKPGVYGRGIGTQLYRKLLKELEKKGIHSVIGGISLPNVPSVALHEKLGFEKVAQFREVGYKFEKWIDVGYWEKIIS